MKAYRQRERTVSLRLAILWAALLIPGIAWAQYGPNQDLSPNLLFHSTAFNNAHSVATDCRHDVHVIYIESDIMNANADAAPWYRRYDFRQGFWLPPMRLPMRPIADCNDLAAIASDCTSHVHTAWIEFPNGGAKELYYRGADSTHVWGNETLLRVKGPLEDLGGVSIAADSTGNVFVFWHEGARDSGGGMVENIWYRIYDASSEMWLPAAPLTTYVPDTDPGPGAMWPTVAVQNGVADPLSGLEVSVAHIAWGDWTGGGIGYFALSFHHALGATLLGGMLVGPGSGIGIPSIDVRCNRVHLVWAGTAIEHVAGTSTFFGPADLPPNPTPTGFTGTEPNVVIDGLNNAHIFHNTGAGLFDALWNYASGTFTVTYFVSDGGAAFPSNCTGAVDEQGDLHAVWTDSRNPPFPDVFYSRGNCLTSALASRGGPSVANGEDRSLGAFSVLSAASARLTPELHEARESAAAGDLLPIIIQPRVSLDLSELRTAAAGLSKGERRRLVVTTLKEHARRFYAGVLEELASAATAGRADKVRSLWLAQAVSARVTPEELDRLAQRDDIEWIVFDPKVDLLDQDRSEEGSRAEGFRARARKDSAEGSSNGADAQRDSSVPENRDGVPHSNPSPAPLQVEATPAWGVSWIGAPQVWAQGYRGQCVIVAIIDTGVDLTHPDLADHLWTNPGEIPGNGVDDDANGYIDDVHGYDFSALPNGDPDPTDVSGHGTHVAGTVAGDGTGGVATGVAPEARIMAVRVLGPVSTNADVYAGIDYAVDNGADVLNLSLGVACPSPGLRERYRREADAVAAAGVVMCVASGNERCADRPPNIPRTPGDVPPPWLSPDQPDIGSLSAVTSVGATRYLEDVIAGFSSPGPVDWSQPPGYGDWALCSMVDPHVGLIKPDVSAPGVAINSTRMGGGYKLDDGTSMASPHVAGLAALILSKNHALTSAEVDQILETTALDLGPPGKDNNYGAGRVRAAEAIAATPWPTSVPLVLIDHAIDDGHGGGDGDGLLEPGETAEITVDIMNNSSTQIDNVIGILQVNRQDIEILDDTGVFGDIPPSQVRSNVGHPFRILVGGNASPGVVHFSVALSGDGVCAEVFFDDEVHEPPFPTGACCMADGSCRVLGESDCRVQCGNFQGLGGGCNPSPCLDLFRVTSTDPRSGQGNVAWQTSITATFSHPVSPSSLAAGRFLVGGATSGPITGTVVTAPNGLSATFTPSFDPSETFGAGQQVRATIVGTLQSQQGVQLDSPFTWDFRTFAQHGDGNFDSPMTLTPGSSLTAFAAGDLDADGKWDLAACGLDGRVSIYRNTTPSGGALTYQLSSIPVGVALVALVLDDFNADGKLDIAVADRDANLIRIGLNSGNGLAYQWSSFSTYASPRRIASGDLDGDGFPDLIAALHAYQTGGYLWGYHANGSGGVRDDGLIAVVTDSENSPPAIAIRDINLDGLQDIAMADGTALYIFRSLGPPYAFNGGYFTYSAGNTPSSGLILEDVNGDRWPEALRSTGQGYWIISVASLGACGSIDQIPYYLTGDDPAASLGGLAPLDFDGDGDQDLAVTNRDLNHWLLMENDGTGAYTPRNTITTQSGPGQVLGTDFNQDGVVDVAILSPSAHSIQIFLGHRLPSAVPSPDVTATNAQQELVAQPNPFRDSVAFTLPGDGLGRMEIFDTGGRLVRYIEVDGATSRNRTIIWDGRGRNNEPVPSGFYHVRLTRGGMRVTTRVMRLH